MTGKEVGVESGQSGGVEEIDRRKNHRTWPLLARGKGKKGREEARKTPR